MIDSGPNQLVIDIESELWLALIPAEISPPECDMTKRFVYEVAIPRSLRWSHTIHDAAAWCNEEFSGRWNYRGGNPDPEIVMFFCFERAADAVYFKLRWFDGEEQP